MNDYIAQVDSDPAALGITAAGMKPMEVFPHILLDLIPQAVKHPYACTVAE